MSDVFTAMALTHWQSPWPCSDPCHVMVSYKLLLLVTDVCHRHINCSRLGPRLQFIGSNGHKSKQILQHLADIPTNCVVKDSDGPNFEDNQCRCGLPFISI